jgi:hypothetical protein
MAILLDPRFMGGYLFILMAASLYDGNVDLANKSAMDLMLEYKNKCLISSAISVAKFIEDAK